MKRSEMIKLMVESIELHAGNDPDWLNRSGMERRKEEAYELASKLLRDMTDAGMLPPEYSKARIVTNRYGREFNVPQKKNDWEPEDD
jgi:hypothetical protein